MSLACRPVHPEGTSGGIEAVVGQYGGAITAVAVADGRAYLGTGRRLHVLDLRPESAPRLIAQSPPCAEAIRAIAVLGDYVIAAVGGSGLAIYEVQQAPAITRVATRPTVWSSYDVAAASHYACVAEGTRGLRVLDLAEPRRPRDLARAVTPGTALAVAVEGHRAYVADWGMGVQAFDISDPTAPRKVMALDTPAEAADLAFDQGHLFVADRQGGLRVLEVSEAALREVAAVPIAGAERVAAAVGRAYVATETGGLHVLDARSPKQPRRLAPFAATKMPSDVTVAAGRVFIADTGAAVAPARTAPGDRWLRFHLWGVESGPEAAVGLAGLHIAEPSEQGLTAVGFCPSPSLIEAAVAHPTEPLLYLADGGAVVVLDIARPEEQVLVGILGTPGPANDVLLFDGRALVAAGTAGLVEVDITDPRALRRLRTWPLAGAAERALIHGHYAYVAAEMGGLQIVQLGPASAAATGRAPGESSPH